MSGLPDLEAGLELGIWTLGKKIGDGEFGQVFEARTPRLPGTYALKVCEIARGPKEKKVKATTQSAGAVGLAIERRAYVLQLKGVPHIPALPPNNYGDDQGYRYLVMQLMSSTLKDKASTIGGRFSPAAIAHVGTSLLEALEAAHSKGFLYFDLKPANVMLGAGADADSVFLVDWGCMRSYRDLIKRDFLPEAIDAGNDMYRSIHNHDGTSSAPRDDLESLAYLLVWMATGRLPWQDGRTSADLAALKKATSTAALTRACPEFVKEFVETVKELPLQGADDVDYAALARILAPNLPKTPRSFVWPASGSVIPEGRVLQGSSSLNGASASAARSKPSSSSSAKRSTSASRKTSTSTDSENAPVVSAAATAATPLIKTRTRRAQRGEPLISLSTRKPAGHAMIDLTDSPGGDDERSKPAPKHKRASKVPKPSTPEPESEDDKEYKPEEAVQAVAAPKRKLAKKDVAQAFSPLRKGNIQADSTIEPNGDSSSSSSSEDETVEAATGFAVTVEPYSASESQTPNPRENALDRRLTVVASTSPLHQSPPSSTPISPDVFTTPASLPNMSPASIRSSGSLLSPQPESIVEDRSKIVAEATAVVTKPTTLLPSQPRMWPRNLVVFLLMLIGAVLITAKYPHQLGIKIPSQLTPYTSRITALDDDLVKMAVGFVSAAMLTLVFASRN